MWDIPVEIFLSWPIPNYVNPVTRGPETAIVSSIFLALSTLFVCVRLYSRIFIRHWVGRDDVLIVIAYVASVGVTTCVAIGNAKYDWNKHTYDMPISHVSSSIKVLYAAIIFWGVSSSCVRLSILCLYYRLIKRCHAPPSFRLVLHCVTGFTTALLIVYLFTGILPCIPVSEYFVWPPDPHHKCINTGAMMLTGAILNTLSEVVIAVLPIFAVFSLRVDPRQRKSVLSLLSLGFIVALAGCFRTFFVWKTTVTYDMAWWSTPHWICSEIEIDLALMCACAVPLRPLIGRFIQRRKNSSVTPDVEEGKQEPRVSGVDLGESTSSSTPSQDDNTTWARLAYRSIDLEGIEEDGYGYTVTITGPPKQRSKLKKKSKHLSDKSQSSYERKGSISSASSNGAKPALEVQTRKTFSLSESYRDPALRQPDSLWAAMRQPLSEQDIDLAIEQAGIGALDWSLLEDLEPAASFPGSGTLSEATITEVQDPKE